MAVDTDQDTEPLDQQGAQPLSPGEQASLDQIETGLDRPLPAPSGGGGKGSKSKLKGKLMSSSKTKWIVGGTLGLGGLAGIAAILFFLILFKNVHIKTLFLDYEFAKYNRAFRNRLEQSITDPEASPSGTAESTVSPTDTPEAAIKDMDPAKVKEIKADSSALKETVAQVEAFDASTGGTMGAVDGELGIETSLPDEGGKSSEEAVKDTEKALKEEVGKGETAKKAPNAAVDEAVKDAGKALEEGAAPEAAAKAASGGFVRGMNSFFSKATGPFLFATVGCIARDIYITGYKAVVGMKFSGLARSAAFVNKTADCQKQGKCSMDQIGTVAKKFDNGKESATQSAGYARATNQPVTSATPDLDPNLRPTPRLAGSTGNPDIDQALAIADGINSISNLPLIGDVCGIVLKPATQIAFAGLNIGAVVLGLVTDTVDFGASTAVQAGAITAGIMFESKVGKALALDAALHFGGLLFKQNFSPIQWGNLMGAGDKALATSACAANGCRPLTQKENTQLALAIHADQIKEAKQKGIAYRLFSPKNPTSTLGLIADRTPSSPQAMTATIGRFFATMLNPQRAMKNLFALINPIRPAWAADVSYNTYGIPDYGFTDEELNKYGVVENSRWVQNNIQPDQKADFDKCFDLATTKTADLLTGENNGSHCNDLASGSSIAFKRYRLYKLDQRVTQNLVLLYNNQSSSSDASGTSSSGVVPSGDSAYLAQQLLDNAGVLKVGRLVPEDLQATAKGEVTSSGSALSSAMLRAMVALAENHGYRITSLAAGGTGHATHSRHYTGDGVDIDQVDGQAVTGRNAPSLIIISVMGPVLPAGSRFGQAGCGPDPIFPQGISTFEDSCNHLHIDVPVGTP